MKSKILVLTIVVLGVLQANVAQKRAGSTKVKPPTAVAPKPSLLSPREQTTIDEINLARANPAAYIKFLEQFRKLYNGKSIHYSDGSELVTVEGVAALDEAIAFMRPLKPLPPLCIITFAGDFTDKDANPKTKTPGATKYRRQ